MQKRIYEIDEGVNFGKWNDKTSKFMYFDCMKAILKKIDINGVIADYGGANSNLKAFLSTSISIDIDKSKNPDIEDDILKHESNYDWIVIRYVLHYMNDYEVLILFEKIKSFHKGKVLVIQFCNEDLKTKYANSINELKYFRTEKQLKSLLPVEAKKIFSKNIEITKEFYLNRLHIENAISHNEKINAYLI